MIAGGYALHAACPNGIDVYIDNNGGAIADICPALNRAQSPGKT
jgi:NADPH-dependent curcumin reductase CurA